MGVFLTKPSWRIKFSGRFILDINSMYSRTLSSSFLTQTFPSHHNSSDLLSFHHPDSVPTLQCLSFLAPTPWKLRVATNNWLTYNLEPLWISWDLRTTQKHLLHCFQLLVSTTSMTFQKNPILFDCPYTLYSNPHPPVNTCPLVHEFCLTYSLCIIPYLSMPANYRSHVCMYTCKSFPKVNCRRVLHPKEIQILLQMLWEWWKSILNSPEDINSKMS